MQKEINPKYKIDFNGIYWKGIDFCPECNWRSSYSGNLDNPDWLINNICGFTDNDMCVVECPKCFTRWKFHGDGFYHYFLDRVKDGSNKFFKNMSHTLKGISETHTVFLDGKLLNPELSQKYYNHSPDGFNWGYGGSGPSQL
jgi:hypothetical protein